MDEQQLTTLLNQVSEGDDSAIEEVLATVYHELRVAAAGMMKRQAAGHTLSPTALLHESFIKILPQMERRDWQHRGQFFAAACQAMRSVLIDHARRKQSQKRNPDDESIVRQLRNVNDFLENAAPETVIGLDLALEKLDQQDAVLSKFIQLRFFTGLSVQDAADIVGWSRRTAIRRWQFARAWLHKEILGD